MAVNGSRAIDEEFCCFEIAERVASCWRRCIRQRERRGAPDRFTRHPQRFAAGGHDSERGRSTKQCLGQFGAGIDQMFAVVQHEVRKHTAGLAPILPGVRHDPELGGRQQADDDRARVQTVEISQLIAELDGAGGPAQNHPEGFFDEVQDGEL